VNTSSIEASASAGGFKRMTSARKQSAVLQLLRGDPLDMLSRESKVTAADLSEWQDKFLAAGEASLKARPRDGREAEINRLKNKVSGLTMDNDLLIERIFRIRQGVKDYFGTARENIAEGLSLRHDNGTQYMAHDCQKEIKWLGITSSPVFVRMPECNGRAERFIRTLKKTCSG
jgi:transposase InsO family protein